MTLSERLRTLYQRLEHIPLSALLLALRVGVGTRLATLPLFGMLLVIQTFVYPNAWSDHLFWAGSLAIILSRGPGVFSLDHRIARRMWGNPPR
ncbi:MAG: hypothetical protein HQ485_10170 [Acidobacteria bacterium]|jgi:uncharacterized membrane protein YphA (DoxX/SURF4 family)|nr:hypothetical protein [Acidobacteriota bacterium]